MLSKLRTRLRALLRKSEMDRELDDELRYHIERQTEQNIRLGMNPEEALYEARKVFGGVEQAKERSRDARGLRWLEDLWQDLRYGGRGLMRAPSFTLVAVITLALGIGANTAIFSVVNGVLLEPLPYRESGRLLSWWFSSPPGLPRYHLTQAHFAHYRDHAQSFESITAYSRTGFSLTSDGEPERLDGANVTVDFFRVFGQQMLHGRDFAPEEGAPGKNLVCILSYGLWQRRFGGDKGVVGRSLILNDIPTQVIGVAPPDFDFPSKTALWIPVGLNPQQTGYHFLRPIGRLKPGVTPMQAHAELTRLIENFALARRDIYREGRLGGVVISTPLKDEIVKEVKTPLLALLVAVGFLLLIACGNIANLLLARATLRGREIAIRFALGAHRWRIVRQLLTESLMLAALGAAAGFFLASWGIEGLRRIALEIIPRAEHTRLDFRMISFTIVVALLTGLLFGLAPAISAARVSLQESLKESVKSSPAKANRRINDTLVVCQIMMSLLLLVGTGLLLRSFQNLLDVNPGFRAENTLALRISLPSSKGSKYTQPEQSREFFQRLRENVASLPGVRAAGLVTTRPLSGQMFEDHYTIEGQDQPGGRPSGLAARRVATPGFFEAMGTPVLQGRAVLESDHAAAPLVAVIDEELARRHWPNETAVGKRIHFGPPGNNRPNNPWLTIVGVVATVKDESLDEEAAAHLYMPLAQVADKSLDLIVWTAGDPIAFTSAVQRQVRGLDSQLPIFRIQTMERAVAETLGTRRLTTLLLGAFALTALALAAVGIYGVMSLNVNQCFHEFGVRVALGARARDVLGLTLWRGMRLVLLGIGLGLLASFALTRWLKVLLFGVSPTDPLTFISISFLLIIVALVACWGPARRATRVDPMGALRSE
jgi:predicted permease